MAAAKLWVFGKSKAKLLNEAQGKVTFNDVAGVEEAKEEVEEIMSYPDDSAGSIMTKENFTLNQSTSVKDSIKKLQSFPENDKIFYLYVLDNKEKLVGVVSFKNIGNLKKL